MSSSNSSKGRIVLVELPFTNLTGSKSRPSLVVSSDAYNQNSPDVVVAKITGSGYGTPYELALNASMLKSGALNKPCFIDLGSLWTVEKKLISRGIASLDEKSVKLCDERIRKVFGL